MYVLVLVVVLSGPVRSVLVAAVGSVQSGSFVGPVSVRSNGRSPVSVRYYPGLVSAKSFGQNLRFSNRRFNGHSMTA